MKLGNSGRVQEAVEGISILGVAGRRCLRVEEEEEVDDDDAAAAADGGGDARVWCCCLV